MMPAPVQGRSVSLVFGVIGSDVYGCGLCRRAEGTLVGTGRANWPVSRGLGGARVGPLG
jgi:hypothetical protein